MSNPTPTDANEKMTAPGMEGAATEREPTTATAADEGSRTAPAATSPYSASIDFLRLVYPEGPWALASFPPVKGESGGRFATFGPDEADAAVSWIAAQNEGRRWQVYYHVNPLRPGQPRKATKADISRVMYLHVDVDPRSGDPLDAERERIRGLLDSPPQDVPPPTFVIDSGNGRQALWRLAAPVALAPDDANPSEKEAAAAEVEQYTRWLELKFGADSTHDVSRLLRLPGTINWKNQKGRVPIPARLVMAQPERVYDLAAFQRVPASRAGKAEAIKHPAAVSTAASRKFQSVDELPPGLPLRAQIVIVQGFDPDEPQKFQSRSEALFYACCSMVRADYDDQTIYDVITSPAFNISASVLDKGSRTDAYARKQVEDARVEATDPNLTALNERHAVITNWNGKCRVMEELYDRVLDRYKLTKQSFDDFRNRYLNQLVEAGKDSKGAPVMKPLGHWWLQNPRRREYRTFTFAPGHDTPGDYNLWRGFAVPARPGDCSLFLAHLRDNICRGDDASYNYLVRWMARAVQHPDSPGHSAVVMKGGQGTGKSFFAKTLGSLFGRHFMQVTDPKFLVGSFNAHLRDCVVLFADEAFYAGDKKHESILKMLITEEMLTIEAKGVDAEVAANCVHLLMASNEKWVVPVAGDDRRFFILNVSDARRCDGNYFSAIQAQLDAGGREALLHYLLTMDLGGFDVREVPKTAEHQAQKEHSMSAEDEWIGDLIERGVLPGCLGNRPHIAYSNPVDAYATGLYRHARETVPALKLYSDRKLSVVVKQWGAKRWGDGDKRGWEFPPLRQMRTAWVEKYGPHEWPGGPDAEWSNGADPGYAAFERATQLELRGT